MTGPLKLVVRLSKPKDAPAINHQEPSNSEYSNPKPSKQRKREDSKHSVSSHRAPGPYYDASPPFPPAKKHKKNAESISPHDGSVSVKPPKLQLKLSAPQSGSYQGNHASRSALEKPSSSSDGGLSFRLSIPKLSSHAGNAGGGAASKASLDAQAKKRKSDVHYSSLGGNDNATSGPKKLKLLSGISTPAPATKQAPKSKPSRSKASVPRKGWDFPAETLAQASGNAPEDVSQQDAKLSPPFTVKGDASALSRATVFSDAQTVEAPTRSELEKLVEKIQKKDLSDIFRDPVTEAIAPGYFTVISKPMDFTTIRQKISDGAYPSWDALEEDITLMFNNAMTYNTQDTPYYKLARTLLDVSRKLLELARQGVTNFRGRTAGIVRAHNAKIAAEERAEKEAQLAAMKAEKLAARKVADKNAASGLKTVALNSIAADRAPAKPESEPPKPRNNARPIVRENDGRRPLHNDENMRVTYKPLAEVPAAKWGLLVNGASAEGVVFSSDCHHVRLQQHQVSRDGYLTSMARFVLNCSKSVQEYVLNKVVDCVPVESVQAAKPVLSQLPRPAASESSNLPQPRPQSLHVGTTSQSQFSNNLHNSTASQPQFAQNVHSGPASQPQFPQSIHSSTASQSQFSQLAVGGTFSLDKSSGESTAHRLGSLQPSHAASTNLHTLHSRTHLAGNHGLHNVLPGGGVHPGPGMLYATSGALQQAQTLGGANLSNFPTTNKGAGGTASTLLSSPALYRTVPGAQPGAGFPNLYNIGNLPYFGAGQVVQNLSKSHDLLRQG